MTRPTTHWSATGDLHAGAVDGCWWCEEEGAADAARFEAEAEQRYRAMTGMDDPLEVRAERARANRQKLRETRVAAPDGDLRGAAVRQDVSDRDRPAERRTATQGGYLCRHGLYRHEHWCDDHDDHAREGEK